MEMDKAVLKRKKRQFEQLQLVGVSDIAKMLNWRVSKVGTYRTRGKFPEPIGEVGGRPVWLKEQIDPYVIQEKNRQMKDKSQ